MERRHDNRMKHAMRIAAYLLLVLCMGVMGICTGQQVRHLLPVSMALAEEAILGPVNERDGSKIEGIEIHWITEDSTVNNEGEPVSEAELADKTHLYLATLSDAELSMKYQIEVSFSGQYDYAPGDIQITIPAQVWHARTLEDAGDGKMVGVVDASTLIGNLDLSVPAYPSTKADFNWQLVNGNYVLTNTRTVGATSKAMFQFTISGLIPHTIVDMSECDPITAHCEVVTNKGNIIEMTSNAIAAQIDTRAVITYSYKNGELYEELPGSLPATLLQQLPEGTDANDYMYVNWRSYVGLSGNQYFSLKIDDMLADAYRYVTDSEGNTTKQYVTDGIFLGCTNYQGVFKPGEGIDFTADISKNVYRTPSNYAYTVYMWSAYKKSDFTVPKANEPQIVYYMENDIIWTLTETDAEKDPGLGKPVDVQKVTTSSAHALVTYSPMQWTRPRGAFEVDKWTEKVPLKDYNYGYGLNKLLKGEEVDMNFVLRTIGDGYPWTCEKTFSEDRVLTEEELDALPLASEDYGVLGWRQITEDFQTFFNFEDTPLTSEDFEFKSLRISVPYKYRWGKKSNGTWHYCYDSSLPNPDLQIEYQLNNDGVWHHAATAMWGEDGKGTLRFVDVASGVSTSGYTVYFPENVTDIRHIFVSNVSGGKTAEKCDLGSIEWYVYPTITLKASDRVVGIAEQLFAASDTPSTKFKNDVRMDVDGWVKADGTGSRVFWDDFDSSRATISGASYGVSLSKSVKFNHASVDNGGDNDVENQRAILHYAATLTERSNLMNREDYDTAVADGVIPAETRGIWYDLLPEGVSPLMNTIKLREGDTITNSYVIANYRDTGRILLVVEAALQPNPVYSSAGYADKPTISFDAVYSWDDIDDLGSYLVNYIAFESKVDDLWYDTLGTIEGQRGEPDDPRGGNNKTTPKLPDDIAAVLTGLDPTTTDTDNRFVYGKAEVLLNVNTAALSGIAKVVSNDLVGSWTQGLDGQEQVTVYEGQYYTYRLRVSSAETTSTSNIVVYDTIENYHIPDPKDDSMLDATKAADFYDKESKKDWQGDWQGIGQWRGTLVSVDLSEYLQAGIAPVLYYSVLPDLTFADSTPDMTQEERLELFSKNEYDIANENYWTQATLDANGCWTVPEALSGKISAVALDARTAANGEGFVLEPGQAIIAYLHMLAPDDNRDESVWNAKGAYAHKRDDAGNLLVDESGNQIIDWEAAADPKNNMYAFNNTRLKCVQSGADGGGSSSDIMIRNDYTRVGILPGVLSVKKVWNDQNNHDNLRPEEVTVTLMSKLAGSGEEPTPVLKANGEPESVVLNEENDWSAQFVQLDIVDVQGTQYIYSFDEGDIPGYTSATRVLSDAQRELVNTHANEQVQLTGVKLWDDENNQLNLRPDSVKVKLYRDGEYVKTVTARPDSSGNWTYSFGKLDKYEEGGREYVYTIEEEYVPKYVAESEGYLQLTNRYSPYGDLEILKTLENATEAARENEFTFILTLMAERTAEQIANQEEPTLLADPYRYEILTLVAEDTWEVVTSGEMYSGNQFKLKEGQKLVVYDLPSESTYVVEEEEKAGFTLVSSDGATGAIRAGQTARAEFVNSYQAKANVQLSVNKHLTGHALRKSQFRFELTDMTEGSETYGQVVRTAYSGVPTTEQAAIGQPIISDAEAFFGQLNYTQEDDGKTFLYKISETKADKPGYTYDSAMYMVAVTVKDNGDGTMTTTAIRQDTQQDVLTNVPVFNNTYAAEGELVLKAWKVLEGRELEDGEFTFELWAYNSTTGNTVGNMPLSTAKNDAEGNVVFDALQFDQDDVALDEENPAKYYYLVKEVHGYDKTVVYSDQVYLFEVTVYDNNDGTLSFTEGSQVGTRNYTFCTECYGTGHKAYPGYTGKYYVNGKSALRLSGVGEHGGRDYSIILDEKVMSCIQLCKLCDGTGYDFSAPVPTLCARCQGTGLEKNQTITYRSYDNQGNEETYQIALSDKFEYLHLAGGDRYAIVSNDPLPDYGVTTGKSYYYFESLELCPICGGTGRFEADMTITGEQSMPVFVNELEDGALSISKAIDGENPHPEQEFTFHVRLTGEEIDTLDFDLVTPAPTATPTATPVATATPSPTANPYTPPEPVDTSTYYHATEDELKGEAYAVLDTTTGKMVFFRAEDEDEDGELTDSVNGRPFEFSDAVERVVDGQYIYYGNFETLETASWSAWPWANDRESVVTIETKDAIQPHAASEMFYKFGKLTHAELTKLDTSKVLSFSSMFDDCSRLTTLDVSHFDTSKATNFSYMFNVCRSLTTLDVSHFDTSKATNFGGMFSNCSSLKTLDVSHFDTSSATKFRHMFNVCSSLTTLDVSNFDTSKATDFFSMFYHCSRLTTLDVSNFDTSKATNFGTMFDGCRRLTTLDVSNFDTSKATNFYSMFYGCSSLTTLDVSSFDTSKAMYFSYKSDFSYMFSGCGLEMVKIGDKFVITSSGLPTLPPSAQGEWVNIATGVVLKTKDLFTKVDDRGHEGIWIANTPIIKLSLKPGTGSGSMPDVEFDFTKPYTFTPTFYNYGYKLTGFTDEKGKTFPVNEDGTVTIPADTYSKKDMEVTLTAQWDKLDTSITLTDNTFTLTLHGGESAAFTLPAGIAYEVWEDTPAGWVLVSKTGDSGVIQPLETSEAVFTNKYSPDEARVYLRASKTLDGNAAEKDAYLFALADSEGKVLQTVRNAAGGAVTFDALTYGLSNAGKTYTYTIYELKGDNGTISYDTAKYTVKVAVQDDGNGNLTAVATYQTTDGNPPTFRNTTKPGSLEIVKNITGTLTDKAKEQVFTFEVSFTDGLFQPWTGAPLMNGDKLPLTDGKAVISIKGGEKALLTDIPAGVAYEVRETTEQPGWTLESSTNTAGTIASTETAQAVFANAYSVKGTAVVEATKELSGRTQKSGEFTFELLQGDQVLATATNEADGTVRFPELTYTEPGKYVYTIRETTGSDPTVRYSSQKITATVVMTDEKGEGRLTANVSYVRDDVDQTNVIRNEIKTGSLQVTKHVAVASDKHTEQRFEFALYLTDATGAPITGTFNVVRGQATETLTVTAGRGVFTLSDGETVVVNGLPHGTSYSLVETVVPGYAQRSTGATGKIVADKTAEAVYTNTYHATGAWQLMAEKVLDGAVLQEGQFSFELLDEAGHVLQSVRNTANGTIVFDELGFDEEDIGTRVFRVREVNTSETGYTYDSTVRAVRLTIEDNGDGTLSVMPDGTTAQGIVFNNAYCDTISISATKVWVGDEEHPETRCDITLQLYAKAGTDEPKLVDEKTIPANATGDELTVTWTDQPLFTEDGKEIEYSVKERMSGDAADLYASTIMGSAENGFTVTNRFASVSISLTAEKVLTGCDLEAEQFTFQIRNEADEVVSSAKNNQVGQIVFEPLVYTLKDLSDVERDASGNRTKQLIYTVSELDEAAPGYTYDDTAYTLTVTLREDKDSVLHVEHVLALNGAAVDTLCFANTYEAAGELVLKATKTVNGAAPAADENGLFTFELLEGEKVLQRQTNNGATVTFDALAYTLEDVGKTYTYKVKETEAGRKGYTVDKTEYTVEVSITDNRDGTLGVSCKVDGEADKAMTFANTYEAAGELVLKATKTVNGAAPAADENGLFTFELLEGEKVLQRQTNNGATVTFEALAYTLEDAGKTYTYKVKETEAGRKGYTVDRTEYTVEVSITDNRDGTLGVSCKVDGEADKAMTFANTYEAAGELVLKATKTVNGAAPAADENGLFTFELVEGEKVLQRQTNEGGTVTFEALAYTLEDAGKTYTYKVKETEAGRKGYTVDRTEYTVEVSITDNRDGTLGVSCKVDGEADKAMTFSNIYEAAGELVLKATKTVNGATPREDQVFRFELSGDGLTEPQIKENVGGTVIFDALRYTLEDAGKSFVYKVREIDDSQPGYTADKRVYTVGVWVQENREGELSVRQVICCEEKIVQEMCFDNRYEAKGELVLTARKLVNGREPAAHQTYQFELSGETITTQSRENEGGLITFEPIRYTLEDAGKTYIYTIRETTESTDLLGTDPTVYEVVVSVSDSKDGTLAVEAEVRAEGEKTEEVIFRNTLNALLTISKAVSGCETEEAFRMTVHLYDAEGQELTGTYRYTGDRSGELVSGDTVELRDGEKIVLEGLEPGMKYSVSEERDMRFATTVNGAVANEVNGTLEEGGSSVAFVNTLRTTTFTVSKQWQGGSGAITLTLYADNEKMNPQPAYTREGDVYSYSGLPKYDADGRVIVYAAKEKYVDGYLTIYRNVSPYEAESSMIYDGGTIINRAVTSIRVKKVWVGLEEGEEAPEITLTLYCNGEKMEKKTPKPDANGWYVFKNLPITSGGKTAVYTVQEEPMEGYVVTYTDASGVAAEYAGNGATITNTRIPETGDRTPIALYAAMVLSGCAGLILNRMRRHRRSRES